MLATHEEEIREIVAVDYEILDVVLENKLRNWYKERGLEFPEWFKPVLLNNIWLNYARWN